MKNNIHSLYRLFLSISILFLSGCNRITSEFSYQPPVIPVKITVNNDGEVKFSTEPGLKVPTLLGTFSSGLVTEPDRMFKGQNTLTIRIDNVEDRIYDLGETDVDIDFSSEDYKFLGIQTNGNNLLVEIERYENAQPFTEQTIPMNVYANKDWQRSGIEVEEGDLISITYVAGFWSPWAGGFFNGLGSGGDPDCSCNILMGVSHAALLGRIGNHDPFYVGNQFTQKTVYSGQLYLRINDSTQIDNSGGIHVEIKKSGE